MVSTGRDCACCASVAGDRAAVPDGSARGSRPQVHRLPWSPLQTSYSLHTGSSDRRLQRDVHHVRTCNTTLRRQQQQRQQRRHTTIIINDDDITSARATQRYDDSNNSAASSTRTSESHCSNTTTTTTNNNNSSSSTGSGHVKICWSNDDQAITSSDSVANSQQTTNNRGWLQQVC